MSQRKQRKFSRESKNLTRKNSVFFELEGSTEKQYLQKLRQIIKELDCDIIFNYGESGGKSPKTCIENLVQKKRNSGQEGDLFIAICDVDDFDKRKKSGHPSNLQKAVSLAKQHEIILLISNICFEQWLEFHRSEKQYLKDKDNIVKKELSKLVVKDKNFIKKNISNAYKIAKKLDNLEEIYPKSYGSRVWQLLEKLKENFPNSRIKLEFL